jgi:hypothetical protein
MSRGQLFVILSGCDRDQKTPKVERYHLAIVGRYHWRADWNGEEMRMEIRDYFKRSGPNETRERGEISVTDDGKVYIYSRPNGPNYIIRVGICCAFSAQGSREGKLTGRYPSYHWESK